MKEERRERESRAFATLAAILKEKYFVEYDDPHKQEIKIRVSVGKGQNALTALVRWATGEVECEDSGLRSQLQNDMGNLKLLL